MSWKCFCECFVLLEKDLYKDQTISHLKNVKICCEYNVNVMRMCKCDCDGFCEMKLKFWNGQLLFLLNVKCVQVGKFFLSLSCRGDFARFFTGFEVSCNLNLFTMSSLHEPSHRSLLHTHLVFHVGCTFRRPLKLSNFWHFEWLGMIP